MGKKERKENEKRGEEEKKETGKIKEGKEVKKKECEDGEQARIQGGGVQGVRPNPPSRRGGPPWTL